MIARLAWYAALLAIAVVTAAVQLDRQSAVVPGYTPLVPEPARGFAQAQITARILASGQGERAVAQAQRLVERRPIPAETVRLLAQAQIAAGRADEGLTTIQIAAQRGWRDPAAQEAMLRLATAARDDTEAARRYTALLLKASTEDALLEDFGTRLFASPDGPAAQALIEVLSGSERWPDIFLMRAGRVLPPKAFVAIVTAAIDRGTQFDCKVLHQSVRSLNQRSEMASTRLDARADQIC